MLGIARCHMPHRRFHASSGAFSHHSRFSELPSIPGRVRGSKERGFSHSKIPGALKESSSQFEASSLKIRELLLRDTVADPLPPGKLAAR